MYYAVNSLCAICFGCLHRPFIRETNTANCTEQCRLKGVNNSILNTMLVSYQLLGYYNNSNNNNSSSNNNNNNKIPQTGLKCSILL